MDPLINPILFSDLNQPTGIEAQALRQNRNTQKACKEFEALFTSTLFSKLADTIQVQAESGVDQMQEKWIWGMMFQTIAQEMIQNQGLGLEKEVMQSIENNLEKQGESKIPTAGE